MNLARTTFILFLFSFSGLFAHSLILKNGQIVQGKITNVTKEEVHINVNGVGKIYSKTLIKEISYKESKKIEVKKVTVEKSVSEKKKRPLTEWDLSWRSAILPGYGLYKVKKKKWALIEGATAFLALFYANGERQKALQQKNVYTSKQTVYFSAIQSTAPPGDLATPLIQQFILGVPIYNAYQTQVNKFNQSIQIFTLIYAAGIIHAWIAGKRNAASDSPVTSFNFGILPGNFTKDATCCIPTPGIGALSRQNAWVEFAYHF